MVTCDLGVIIFLPRSVHSWIIQLFTSILLLLTVLLLVRLFPISLHSALFSIPVEYLQMMLLHFKTIYRKSKKKQVFLGPLAILTDCRSPISPLWMLIQPDKILAFKMFEYQPSLYLANYLADKSLFSVFFFLTMKQKDKIHLVRKSPAHCTRKTKGGRHILVS